MGEAILDFRQVLCVLQHAKNHAARVMPLCTPVREYWGAHPIPKG